jgi:ADP-heptose:LPS heptosyltransferase
MIHWIPWLVGSIACLCLVRPRMGLTALLALLILGDRQAAYLSIPIQGITLYITEASLLALLINTLASCPLEVFWSRSLAWKGFYSVSIVSMLRGLLIYPLLRVLRDAALSYYSLFTLMTRRLFQPGTAHLRKLGFILAGAVILKSVLSLFNVHFFYQEGSAAGIYTVDTIILSLFVLPIGNRRRWYWYPVLGFLAYQVTVYLFRSSWFGLAVGGLFYLATYTLHRTPWRSVAAYVCAIGVGVGIAIRFPPGERFQKPLGQTDNAALVSLLRGSLDSMTNTTPTHTVTAPATRAKPLAPTAAPASNVLAQFGSLWAGINSKNINTRVWLWQDFIEDLFTVRFPFNQQIRLPPELTPTKDRIELEKRLGPFQLDSEIPNSWRKSLTIGSPTLKRMLGVPFGKVFLPPRTFYWMTKTGRYDPHNSFLSVLYRLGVVGFIFFLGLLGWEAHQTMRCLPRLSSEDRLIALGLLGAIVSHCTDAFFSVSFENAFKGVFLWIFIGALQVVRSSAIGQASETGDVPANPREPTRLNRILLRRAESISARIIAFIAPSRRWTGPIQRIGFIEVNRLGDVVLSGPALDRLRSYYPKAHIVLIVSSKFKECLKDHPAVNEYFELDVPWMEHRGKYLPWRYVAVFRRLRALRQLHLDAILDTRGDLRRQALMAYAQVPLRISYNRTIGGIDVGSRGKLLTQVISYPAEPMHRVDENVYLVDRWCRITQEMPGRYVPAAKRALRSLTAGEPLQIGLHIHSHWPNKIWRDTQWIELLGKIQKRSTARFSVWGDSREFLEGFQRAAAQQKIQIQVMTVPLTDLAARLAHLDILLTVDSGPMHIADQQGCRVIALFGPSDITTWHPYNNGLDSVIHRQAECPIAPCKSPTCRMADSRCMQQITVDDVFAKFEQTLDHGVKQKSGIPVLNSPL